MSAFRKILVPTDFSPQAAEAVRVAHDLAEATGASLVVFHMFRPQAVASGGESPLAALTRAEEEDVWEELRRIQAKDPAVRVDHEVIVADRPDAEHILRTLQERRCDLIVMGTHARMGLWHLLFGSVTEEVVRKARCPVMVVKAPPHVAAAPTHATATPLASRFKS
jgi:nucleotide-binding universal stress UspA family protein